MFKKILIPLLLIFVTIFSTLFLRGKILDETSIFTGSAVIQRFEKTGKLQVITFYMDTILDETVKKSLLWVDELFPDSKVLISVKSEISACVDLSEVDEDDISKKGGITTITLPEPEFCSEPVINMDTVETYLSQGFDSDELQIRALQNGQELVKEQAIENQIFELAKDQAKVIVTGLLAEFSDDQIEIVFEN